MAAPTFSFLHSRQLTSRDSKAELFFLYGSMEGTISLCQAWKPLHPLVPRFSFIFDQVPTLSIVAGANSFFSFSLEQSNGIPVETFTTGLYRMEGWLVPPLLNDLETLRFNADKRAFTSFIRLLQSNPPSWLVPYRWFWYRDFADQSQKIPVWIQKADAVTNDAKITLIRRWLKWTI